MSLRNFRPILVALVALLFYTVTDILVWQRVFETHQMFQFASSYHTGWFVSLAGYAVVGTLLMWGAWRDCLYFILCLVVGAFSGMEDLLYYLLDGKPIPDHLPWLASNPMIYHPTRAGVMSSVGFWVLALALVYILLYLWRAGRRPPLQYESSGRDRSAASQ
jgi:hypothetical protein